MIKYSVLYPNIKGGTFDHDYYRNVHLPLIKRRMGEYLLGVNYFCRYASTTLAALGFLLS